MVGYKNRFVFQWGLHSVLSSKIGQSLKSISRRWEATVFVVLFAFFFFVLPVVVFVTILFWPLVFAALWEYFHAVQKYWWVRVLVLICLTGIAFLFHRIKRASTEAYGFAEIIMGMVASWIVLRNMQADRMTVTIGLAASVYFIVRGFDNFLKETPIEVTDMTNYANLRKKAAESRSTSKRS